MLNKTIKGISYSTLSLALYMGNLNIPTDYFEDSYEYSLTPKTLNNGYGFSTNKAYASCESTTADDCYTFGPPPVVDPPWYGTPPPEPPGNDDPYEGSSGGGGNSGSDSGNNSQTPKEECLDAFLEEKNNCITTAETLWSISAFGCANLGHPMAIAACEAAAYAARVDQLGNCEEEYQKNIRQCN